MSRGRRWSRPVIVVLAVWTICALVGVSASYATHWSSRGWYHEHKQYPATPNGLTALNSTFGTRCTADRSDANHVISWYGPLPSGDVVIYVPHYNKKLGGASTNGFWGTPRFPNAGSTIMEDVYGHLEDDHRNYPFTTSTTGVKGGIWGYLCRQISGSTKWSSHSWGVAIDINAAYEQYPDPNCAPNSFGSAVSDKWTNHGFYWGANFGAGSCDPMHFQYVTGY